MSNFSTDSSDAGRAMIRESLIVVTDSDFLRPLFISFALGRLTMGGTHTSHFTRQRDEWHSNESNKPMLATTKRVPPSTQRMIAADACFPRQSRSQM